ncbi:MAG: LPD23 domain-containing protein [Pseudomonadota bacterium]
MVAAPYKPTTEQPFIDATRQDLFGESGFSDVLDAALYGMPTVGVSVLPGRDARGLMSAAGERERADLDARRTGEYRDTRRGRRPILADPEDVFETPETLSERYKHLGMVFDRPMSARAAEIMAQEKEQEQRLEEVMAANPSDLSRMTGALAGGFAASMTDPVELFSGVLPFASAANKAWMAARLGRRGAAVATGAVEGAAGNLLLEPIYYGLSKEAMLDYTMYDAAMNVGIGAALGGSIGAFRAGEIDRAVAQVRGPETALDQIMKGKTVDVANIDPELAQINRVEISKLRTDVQDAVYALRRPGEPEDFDPAVDAPMTPRERRTLERQARKEAQAAGEIWSSFFESAFSRYGVTVAQVRELLPDLGRITRATDTPEGALAKGPTAAELTRSFETDVDRYEARIREDLEKQRDELSQAIEAERKQAPMVSFLKRGGGVDPEGDLGKRLIDRLGGNRTTAMRRFPGLFKRGGLGAADNIPRNELPEGFDPGSRSEFGPYADPERIVSAVERESVGEVTTDRLTELEGRMRGVDDELARMDDPFGWLNQSDRGFFDRATGAIGLFRIADASTFMHESAHLFLDILGRVGDRPEASPELKADLKTLYDWMGVEGWKDLEGGGRVAQLGGPKARTARRTSLRKAEKLEAEGVERETVWKKTGWWNGPNGWRFEIDPDQMEFAPMVRPQIEAQVKRQAQIVASAREQAVDEAGRYDDARFSELIGGRVQASEFKLHEVLEFDALYEAYPDLARVPVYIAGADGFEGLYKYTKLVDGFVGETFAAIGKDLSSIKRTLRHEIQHAIEVREGRDRTIPDSQGSFALYFRDGEETQSRNVERRARLTAAERRRLSPERTQDIPRSIQEKPAERLTESDIDVIAQAVQEYELDQMSPLLAKIVQESRGKLFQGRSGVGRDHPLEKFARGFEQYLRSGEAPVPRLQRIFDMFASWLRKIYTRAEQLDAEISPEVRGVMDRLLTTQDELPSPRELAARDADPRRDRLADYDGAARINDDVGKLSDDEIDEMTALVADLDREIEEVELSARDQRELEAAAQVRERVDAVAETAQALATCYRGA